LSRVFPWALQLLMMPWFMEMGARMFSWDSEGIMATFFKVAINFY
jgi:hypothetical protein